MTTPQNAAAPAGTVGAVVSRRPDPIIMPVRPGTLKATDKAALRKAGVIVVEHESPGELRLLKPCSELSSSDMLLAAMRGVMANDGKARYVFAENILKMLEDVHAG